MILDGIYKMVLIKLEKLSESELRSIAEQESIESWQTLSRDSLIEALTEKYEDENGDYALEDRSENHNLKYLTGLTDYKDISDSVEGLPGVEELPLTYPETSIHLLYKNTNWGYSFWSISNLDREKLEERKASTSLFVTIVSTDGVKEQYDIPVSDEDDEWNIGFPTSGGSCSVALVAEFEDGSREVLARSNTLKLASSYWLNNRAEMKDSDVLYKIYMSLLSTKEGAIVDNPIVKDISALFGKEDVSEQD